MKKILLSSLFLALVNPAVASGVHWGYTGHGSPEHWGDLSPEYAICTIGKNQAPVDLHGFIDAELKPLAIHYQAGGIEVVNNGHSIQVNYTPDSTLDVDGHVYELRQFHFHTPSENMIEGKSYPMEIASGASR